MDTRNRRCAEKDFRADYARVIHQLRVAAGRDHSEARRQRIRDATRC